MCFFFFFFFRAHVSVYVSVFVWWGGVRLGVLAFVVVGGVSCLWGAGRGVGHQKEFVCLLGRRGGHALSPVLVNPTGRPQVRSRLVPKKRPTSQLAT